MNRAHAHLTTFVRYFVRSRRANRDLLTLLERRRPERRQQNTHHSRPKMITMMINTVFVYIKIVAQSNRFFVCAARTRACFCVHIYAHIYCDIMHVRIGSSAAAARRQLPRNERNVNMCMHICTQTNESFGPACSTGQRQLQSHKLLDNAFNISKTPGQAFSVCNAKNGR